jgi:3-dehydroquinate dehydratase-1
MVVSMLKIGGVKLGDLPRVVLSVDGGSPAVEQAAGEGVDILEIRVDLFPGSLTSSDVVDEVKILKRHEIPLIGTIRSQHEGGKAHLSNNQRADLYKKISPLVNAIDLEVNAEILKPVIAVARRNKNVVILSHHDFHSTPSEAGLQQIVMKATAHGADIIKIAALAKNESDVIRLLQFTAANRQKNLVTIAMGNIGSLSRLVFPMAGSLMTYTSVAPSDGQIPAKRLIEDLRFYYPRYNEELINRIGLLEFA